MDPARATLAIALSLSVTGCDKGDGTTGYPDTSVDDVPDTTADTGWDTGGEVHADTAGDGGSDPGPGSGPLLLYDGRRDGSALVPGWSPDDPRPLIVFARTSTETTWHVSMAEVDASGVVGGMVTDWVRFWGWGDLSADAPSLLYEGPVDASARIPGWSADEPYPVIVLSRYTGATTWFVSMAEIAADGTCGGMVTDELRVWGWTSGSEPGSPHVVASGDVGTTTVPGWSVADPPPLIVLTRYAAATTWWLSMAEVNETGSVGGMVTDELRVWGW